MSQAIPDKKGKLKRTDETPLSRMIRIVLLILFDAAAIWFISNAISNGFDQLVAVIGFIAVMFNIIYLLPQAYPFRWMAFGLGFLTLFTIYPIIFTIYVAFTNYGDGHLLTKEQALPLIERQVFLPETGKSYKWTAFKNNAGEYALWLINPEGETFLAKPGEEIQPASPGDPGIGEADSRGIPNSIEGYQRMNTLLVAADKELPNIKFGLEGDQTVQIRNPNEAAELEIRFKYDEATDTVVDQSNGDIYNNIFGTFTTRDGKTIKPGFRAEVGFKNFIDFISSPSLRGPLVQIMTWNFIFPTGSVLLQFSLGLAIAIMFNDPEFPFKKLIQSLLIIPYTVPALISIIMWRGMLNSEFGIINQVLRDIIGTAPRWTTEPFWAKAALLLVQMWLGYPYFFLVCSGALQSIPSELYEAVTIDGANNWQKFRSITLPLLLIAVGPLLIASYVTNFNNFGVIYLFIGGGPPIIGATTPAGHTDLLISYVYKLAFESGGRGVQYGLASAISIVVFFIVGALTLFQYRFTNMWEEASENV